MREKHNVYVSALSGFGSHFRVDEAIMRCFGRDTEPRNTECLQFARI